MRRLTNDISGENMEPKDYIELKEAAKRWKVSVRRVQTLCSAGRIPGAVRFGRDWMIPRNAKKPTDGRTKAGKKKKQEQMNADAPMPKKTPYLYLTDLYYAPGCAENAVAELADNHEAQVLLSAELACSRGEIDKVYKSANYLLEKHSGFYAVLAAGTLLAQCAIWRGDLAMWRRAKIHISEANARNDAEKEIITLCICAVDSMLYDVESFPNWFKIGCFELLHKDTLPAAEVFYAQYLYAVGSGLATQSFKLEGVQGLALMGLLPATIEPMISHAVADKTVIAEIYLRLTCAVAYHFSNNDTQAVRHIDKAIALALPDKLYGILAEYCRNIGRLIEHRLRSVDVSAWNEVSRLFKVYVENWSRLNSKITGRQIVSDLCDQHREVARLAAYKLSDAEIAARLYMSVSGVKQAITTIKNKSGLDRNDFAAIL